MAARLGQLRAAPVARVEAGRSARDIDERHPEHGCIRDGWEGDSMATEACCICKRWLVGGCEMQRIGCHRHSRHLNSAATRICDSITAATPAARTPSWPRGAGARPRRTAGGRPARTLPPARLQLRHWHPAGRPSAAG